MIEDTIARIRTRVEAAPRLTDENRKAILAELDVLENQVGANHQDASLERIQSVLGITEVSTHEASREDRSESLLGKTLDALETSIVELEASHPSAAGAFRRICEVLSRIGI